MKILAQTSEGFLLQATTDEVRAILRASEKNGLFTTLEIEMEIQVENYTSVLERLRELREHNDFIEMLKRYELFSRELNKLKESLTKLSTFNKGEYK